MQEKKNHNNIYAVLVICLGLIVSVWLTQRADSKPKSQKNVSVDVIEETNTPQNDEWKKLLTSVKFTEDGSAYSSISENEGVFDESTLTARLARDIFSRYLLISKSGQAVSPEQADTIANQVLSMPEYTEASRGAVYVASNLKVVGKSDQDSIKKYGDTLNNIIIKRLAETKSTEPILTIVNDAISKEDEQNLVKLNPYIKANKAVISDLLAMPVPSDLVDLHLRILNASSNILADIEGMRQTYTDPVKAFTSINQYAPHLNDFQVAMDDLNSYYRRKYGIYQ